MDGGRDGEVQAAITPTHGCAGRTMMEGERNEQRKGIEEHYQRINI